MKGLQCMTYKFTVPTSDKPQKTKVSVAEKRTILFNHVHKKSVGQKVKLQWEKNRQDFQIKQLDIRKVCKPGKQLKQTDAENEEIPLLEAAEHKLNMSVS